MKKDNDAYRKLMEESDAIDRRYEENEQRHLVRRAELVRRAIEAEVDRLVGANLDGLTADLHGLYQEVAARLGEDAILDDVYPLMAFDENGEDRAVAIAFEGRAYRMKGIEVQVIRHQGGRFEWTYLDENGVEIEHYIDEEGRRVKGWRLYAGPLPGFSELN